jgi:uncharacterized repeat protein (TIGR01451 family)
VFERFSPRSHAGRLAPLTAAAGLFVTILCALALFAATSSAREECGSKLCLDISHSSASASSVSPNSLVTYTVTVRNPGPNTATNVVLTDRLDPATKAVTERINPATGARESALPAGCTASADLITITCSLGSVKPTGNPGLQLSFTVRMPSSSAHTENVASISYDARANDKQDNPKDPTNEAFSHSADVIEVQGIEDIANSLVPTGVPLSLNTDYDGTGATLDDPQTAKFTLLNLLPNFSTTAIVDDDVADPGFVCPTGLKCPTGGWVQAAVPGPIGLLDPFKPPSEFKIEIRHDASQIPAGLTESKYVLLHDNPALTQYEQIKRRCGSNPPPCLEDVQRLADGDFLVKAQVTGNFRWR